MDWNGQKMRRNERYSFLRPQFLVLFLLLSGAVFAFAEQNIALRIQGNAAIPVGNKNYTTGFGLGLAADWTFLPWLGLSLNGAYSGIGAQGTENFSLFEGGIGPLFQWRLNDRFTLQAEGTIGLYQVRWKDEGETHLKAGGTLSAYFHATPYISILAYAGMNGYRTAPFGGLSAGAGISLNLPEIISRKTRVQGEKIEQRPVFPVSYAWYEDNPVAVVRITNNEPNTVTSLSLSFFLEQYMKTPTVFAVLPSLAPGEQADFPVTALFNEAMLDLTENINANALISIDYRSLGSRKRGTFAVTMPVYHRNALSWDDDRRAASFVSSRDPAARLFAKYAGSVMDDMLREDIPRNVQYALALFEALNLYGVSYIIDPASSYIKMSQDASSLDNLNYPYETLFYRGGDCDDLSILFCSLLEVLGIDTAFITTPGHIFMAFEIEASRNLTAEGAEGRWRMLNDDKLISFEGSVWMPVEITIPGEGFLRAVQVGTQEWKRAGDKAKLYPMRDSWEVYPAASVPNAAGRMPVLPEEDALTRAIDNSLARYLRGR
ncbi:MAG: hypothetical protein LBN21_08970 [Treponema sp.]|jgi:hypothetical protein|nr:hypothetical protein [Treponema sp.]